MDAASWLPWSEYRDLREHRLGKIAQLLREVRDKAASEQDWAAGDSRWGLGCRVFERSCYALTQAQIRLRWLRVEGASRGPTHMIFRIGMVPVRFCADLPDRYLSVSDKEAADLEQAFAVDPGLPIDRFWRMTLDTNPKGFTTAVKFVEFDRVTSQTLRTYVIWQDVDVAMEPSYTPNLVPFAPKRESITLEKPRVSLEVAKALPAGDE